MSTLELKAYEIFKNKLGDKEAEVVIDYFESLTEEKYQQKKDILLTKDDKIELISKIENNKAELISKIESNKAELISKIEASKTDMLKWFFGFFMALVIMIIGLYFKK